jgi:hypothetical protein
MLKANPGSEQSLPIEYLDHIISRTDTEDVDKVFFSFFLPSFRIMLFIEIKAFPPSLYPLG